jgi:Regulatory protein YrvL
MKKIIGFSLMGILLALVGAMIFFLHVGLFRVLGIHYESTSVLVKFLVASFVMEIVLAISGFMIMRLLFHYRAISVDKRVKWLITIMVDWFAIHYIDEWLEGIVIEPWTELALAIIFLIFNIIFDDSKKEEE